MNEVVLGTAFGIILGPHVADIFNPRSWSSGSTSTSNAVTLEVTRVVLAVGLFAIGVELPGNYMWKNAKSLSVMVIPTMAFGWVVVAGEVSLHIGLVIWLLLMSRELIAVIYALWPNLNYVSSLAIAACLTPTDPIISAAILSSSSSFLPSFLTYLFGFLLGGRWANRHVDSDIRLLLSAESAANDGLAYPFISISIYLTLEASTRTAIGKWFLVGCLCTTSLSFPPTKSQYSQSPSHLSRSSSPRYYSRCPPRYHILLHHENILRTQIYRPPILRRSIPCSGIFHYWDRLHHRLRRSPGCFCVR